MTDEEIVKAAAALKTDRARKCAADMAALLHERACKLAVVVTLPNGQTVAPNEVLALPVGILVMAEEEGHG